MTVVNIPTASFEWEHRKAAFSFCAALIWNKSPDVLKAAETLNPFKPLHIASKLSKRKLLQFSILAWQIAVFVCLFGKAYM